MRLFKLSLLAICALIPSLALPVATNAQVYVSFSAPPLMPQYQQPPVSDPNYQWIPGYWGEGQDGYYWVPGTWMAAPQAGLLWTPGFWGYQQQQNNYAWNDGYWGRNVGYYGGVNYGAGYYGTGYVGGGWHGNAFRYNTAVTSVNSRYIRNVYVNKTVVVHNVNRYGYNGPGGVRMHPDAQQLAWAHQPHIGATPMQRAHIAEAQRDRNLYVNVNHGKPAAVVTSHAFSSTNRPADFKSIGHGTYSKPASEPAHMSVPNAKSGKAAAPPQHAMKPPGAKSNGKAAPAPKSAQGKAPQGKATHAPA
ncbi:MAG: hypothetical protein WCD38_04185 [Candidatus Tumulicola sp.]